MKRVVDVIAFIFPLFFIAGSALGLELLSDQSLDKISGRAVYVDRNLDTNLFPFNFLDDSPEPDLSSYSQANTGIHKTVVIEFIGVDTIDDFGYTYRQDFYSNFSTGTIVYENLFSGRSEPYGDVRDYYQQNTYSFVLLSGHMSGRVTVPQYFDNDPNIKTKSMTISKSNIDLPAGLTGNILCSYQGNIYSYEDIPDVGDSFLVYPNMQTITTGQAQNGDLAILLPEGFGQTTTWKPVIKNTDIETGMVTEYLVIPEGDRFVHISLNESVSEMNLKYSIGFAHSDKSYADNDYELSDIQTLGTLSITMGPTTVSRGNVFITTNDTL